MDFLYSVYTRCEYRGTFGIGDIEVLVGIELEVLVELG